MNESVPIQVVLAAVLLRVASQFRFYEGQHMGKGTIEKASVNAVWATLCDDYAQVALGLQGAEIPNRYVVRVRPIPQSPVPSCIIADTHDSKGDTRIVVFKEPELAEQICALLNALEGYRGKC